MDGALLFVGFVATILVVAYAATRSAGRKRTARQDGGDGTSAAASDSGPADCGDGGGGGCD